MFTAKDLMTTKIITVDPDDTVDEVISLMLEHGISGLPVVDMSGHLLGVLSEFDLLDLVRDPNTGKNKVFHYMTREVRKVDDRRLPVMRDDRLVGIISRRDLLRYVLHVRSQLVETEESY
jgi:CBS domain-containing protein